MRFNDVEVVLSESEYWASKRKKAGLLAIALGRDILANCLFIYNGSEENMFLSF